MKLVTSRLVADAPKLSALSQKTLPIKVSYAIAKNLNKINSILKVYDGERNKLLQMYAEKMEDGNFVVDAYNNVIIKPEFKEKWTHDITELSGIENEVEIHKVKFDDLGTGEMSIGEMMAIDYMIEE